MNKRSVQSRLTTQLIDILSLGVLVLCIHTQAHAEVYRWVDKDGKVHFTDRKPRNTTKSEDISNQVSKTNIDKSVKQTKKLSDVFPKETDAEKALHRRQAQKYEQQQQKHRKACNKARNMLKKLSGRVSFVDKNGQQYNISEAQRKQEASKLQAQIKRNCH